jgi:hypothetical protein
MLLHFFPARFFLALPSVKILAEVELELELEELDGDDVGNDKFGVAADDEVFDTDELGRTRGGCVAVLGRRLY